MTTPLILYVMSVSSMRARISNAVAEGTGSIQSTAQLSWNDWYNNVYLPAAEKYRGTEYENQVFNNPYAQFQEAGGSVVGNLLANSDFGNVLNALTFGLTGSIGSSLNDTTQNKFMTDRQQAAMEELSRIEGLVQQNQYNSAASQVQREIAAGLNPNLIGLQGEAAAQNPGPNEEAAPGGATQAGEGTDAVVQQLGQGVSSFFSGMLNLYTFFQESQSRSISNTASDIQLLDTVYETAVKQAAGLSGLPSTREEYDALSDADKLSVDETVYENLKESVASGRYKSMGLNRRALNMLKRMTGQVMYDKDGKPTLAFQQQRAAMLKGFYGDTLEAGKSAGHPTMSDPENFASVMEQCATFFGEYEDKLMTAQKQIADLMAPLYQAQERQAKAAAQSAEAQAEYESALYDEDLGKAENEFRKTQAKIDNIVKELDSYLDTTLSELMTGLDQYGIGGKIAKVSLTAIRGLLKKLSIGVNPMMTKAGDVKYGLSGGLQ